MSRLVDNSANLSQFLVLRSRLLHDNLLLGSFHRLFVVDSLFSCLMSFLGDLNLLNMLGFGSAFLNCYNFFGVLGKFLVVLLGSFSLFRVGIFGILSLGDVLLTLFVSLDRLLGFSNVSFSRIDCSSNRKTLFVFVFFRCTFGFVSLQGSLLFEQFVLGLLFSCFNGSSM
jgi:hypothetical protein